jgi:preprotein translocase subunit SecG
VWAPEATIVTPKVAALARPADEAVPRPIPNWDGAPVPAQWPEARLEHANSSTRPPRHVHSVEEAHRQHSRRSRAFMTTAVLASLFVVFVVVMVVTVLLHHSDNPPAGTASAVSPETARLQAATKSMSSKASAARAALYSLNGIPTTVNVAAVIDPYVSSLRRYESVLSGSEVPTSARGAAATVRALLARQAPSLATIDGLPALRLGSYLEGFVPGVTHLQKDLRTLEHALGARTS